MADSIEERLKKMRSGKSNSSSAATTSTVQNRLDAMRSSGNQQSSGGSTAPVAVSAQKSSNGYTSVADLNRATNGAGVSPLEQAARDVAATVPTASRVDTNRHSGGFLGTLRRVGQGILSGLTRRGANYAADAAVVAGNQGGTAMRGVYQNQVDTLNRQIEALENTLNDPTMTERDILETQEALRIAREQLGIYSNAVRSNENTAAGVYETVDAVNRYAQQKAEQSVAGTSGLGRAALSLVPSLTELGLDVGASALVPLGNPADRLGLGLITRGMDTAGQSIREYRQTKGNAQGYAADQQIGQYGLGNIDLYNRPIYHNEDGSISTVESITIEENGQYILLPTVAYDDKGNAKKLTDKQAVDRYHKTGEMLGAFTSEAAAEQYAEQLHLAQEFRYASEYNPVTAANRGLIAGGGVLAGSLASNAVNNGVLKLLKNKGLQNNVIPAVLQNGLAATAYTGGDVAMRELARATTEDDYTPDWSQIGGEAASAFAFGVITGFINVAATSGRNKAYMRELNSAVQERYEYAKSIIENPAATAEQRAAGASSVMDAIDQLRYALDDMQVVGAAGEVKDIQKFLLSVYGEMLPYATQSAGSLGAPTGPLAPVTPPTTPATVRQPTQPEPPVVPQTPAPATTAPATAGMAAASVQRTPEIAPTPTPPPAPASVAQSGAPQLRSESESRDEGLAGGVASENGTRAANYTPTQTTAQNANIGAIERVANTLGRAGQRQMVESYDGQSNAEAYARGFITMYNVGKAGVTGETIVRNTENAQAVLTLNPAQRQIARQAGIVDAQNAVASGAGAGYNTNIETEGANNERAVSVRDGGKRYASQNTGEQVRVVAESAGRDQAGQAQSRPAEGGGAVGAYAGQQVSSAQLGIVGGDTSDTVTVYNGENTREVKKAKKLAAERGAKLVLYTGGDIHQDKVAARGAYDASAGTVYARVDDADYTVDQIVRHELGHDMFAKGELDLDAIREQVKQAAPNGNVDALAEKYVSAYEGAGLTADEAWEECVCDALGGMNEFGRAFESESGNYADAQQQIRSAARETQGARAPPSRRVIGMEGKYNAEVARYSDSDDEGIVEQRLSAEREGNRSGRDADTSREREGHRGRGDENDDTTRSRQSGSTVSEGGVDTEAKGLKLSRKYSDDERKAHADTVAEYFGTTRNWNEVGYVTQDGRTIDFSGRHDGAPGGYRTVDHRDVTDALGVDYGGDGYSDAMVQFMPEGNIRIMPETGGINIQVEPTEKQYEALTRFIQRNHGEVIVDIDNETGDTVESVEYDRGTHSSKIIADIKSYYQNGEMPQQSEVARFHTMFSRKLSELDALREQNEDLRERVDELKTASREAKKQAARADYWQGQTKPTTAPTVREGDIKRVAKDIISGYDSALKADDIAEGLKSVGDYLVQADELTYEDLKERAAEVARKVVENASVLTNSETMEIYRDVKSALGQEMTISAQDAHWIPDWNDWRKRNRSKVNVRINGSANAQPVDVAYTALSEEYPWLFPDEITNPSDQLLQMVDALDSLAPVYQNPYSYDMAQAVEYCTNDIIDMLLSERVRQTAPTFADRQAAKLDEANARTARVRAEERQRADERVARVRDEKNAKIERVREEGRERIDRLREQKNARIAEIKRQGREKMREAVEREAERRERQVEAIKQHYQTQKFEQAERRADSAARTKLLSLVRRMQRMNTNGANRALLNELIGDIDSVSKRITGKSVEKLSDLRDWYLEQKENDPDFISDPHIEKALERLQKRHVADMSLQEVMELTDVLRNIENELRTERRLIDSEDRRDTYMQGIESISNIENSRGSKGGIIDSLVTTELLTPTREMRRVTGYVDDDPLYRLTRDLEAGQRKMFDYTRRAGERFRKWVDDKKLTRRIAGKHAEEIKIQGIGKNGITEVTITPAMRMSLYLHSKNDQNLRHIAGGGITVPDIKLYKQGKLAEAYARGTTVKLEPSQVRSIVAHMTAEERAFADATSAYFNGMSRDAINEVSEKLKGYSLAGVENYFPINTDSNFTKKEMDTIKFDGTIEGMGFLKERVNAANPIMLRDMNAVLTQAIDQHARYVGLAIPVRNFNKVYGVTKASFNDDGSRNGFEGSVQQAIKQKWGSSAANYIEKMMSDLQSPRGFTDAWGQRLAKLRSNYAGATLELNASVAVKQSASYPTAAAVVGWSPLVKALADPRKVNVDTVAKYTPLLWYRSQGYSSQELGDIAKSGKSLPKVLNWIQGMDVATTTELWQAAEYYVRAHDKTLTRGTDAYYKAVAEVYNRIIEETQPNYTTMQRPQLLRSDNEFVKALNMFKTQPFQNYNILYDALGNLRAKQTAHRNTGDAKSKAALQEAQAGAARAISSQVVCAFVFALMQYAWDAFRGKDNKYKDDDGEQTLLSWLKGMGLNMVGSGFGMLPFGSEMLALGENLTDKILQSFGLDPFFEQKWYGFDEAVTGTLTDASNSGLSALVQTITTLQKALDSDKELTDADIESYVRQLVKAAGDVGSLSGTPLNNIKNLFTAAARQIFRRTDGEYVGGYKALRLTSDPSKYASDYYDLLYDAYKNDQSAYKEVYQLMTDSERFSADKIASAIEQRMKKDAGVESVSDLSRRYLDPTQQAKYDKSLKAVQVSAVWRNANTTQRDAALDMIYDYAVGNSDGKKISEKVASGKRYGINETQYILYRVALAVADAQNSDATKRNGSYDQDEATRAAQMMNGVSGDGLGWLWASTNSGWKDKNNPYK